VNSVNANTTDASKTEPDAARPLEGVRIIDLTDHRGDIGPWMLAELGADVIKVEPLNGCSTRALQPIRDDDTSDLRSLHFSAYASNKRSIQLDLDDKSDRETFLRLVETADFLYESGSPSQTSDAGLDRSQISERNPRIVHVLVTPFGADGPRAKDSSSELSIASLGGSTNLQGVRQRPPVKASIPQVWRHAGAESAVAGLVAHSRMLTTGEGQYVVVSAQACMTWTLLNAMEAHAIQGADVHRSGTLIRLTEIPLQIRIEASDGWLIALSRGATAKALAPWLIEEHLVEPSWLDEDWDTLDHRVLSGENTGHTFSDIFDAVSALCLRYPRDVLMHRGLELGVTLAPINDVQDLLNFDHLELRRFWRTAADNRGFTDERIPGGFLSFDGKRLAGHRRPPHLDEHHEEIRSELDGIQQKPNRRIVRASEFPLEGLKVADFSWVGVGPITAKALADHGATVVRVESGGRLDPLRVNAPFKDGIFGENRSHFFGTFNTSKMSIDIDLKHQSGIEIAQKLIAWADVVIESWSPGAFSRAGLSDEVINSLNPSAIVVHTSLLASGGPLSPLAGYGYHAAAIAGYYEVVGWPDLPPDGPYLAYTDTISPRFITPAVLAAIDRRRQTGNGCVIEAAQLECGLQLMAPELLDFQVNNRKATRRGNRDLDMGPQGVYPVQGDDRWIAITVQSDENWVSLQTLMGTPQWAAEKRFETTSGRIDAHELLDRGISEWTVELNGQDLETKLLAQGVPAGLVARSSDLLADPQYQHLGFYRWHDHPEMGRVPYAGHQYSIEGYDHGPRAAAPLLGEHTFEVLSDFLNFDADAIAQLAIDGALG
jgi:crotonobetainyl-CoA:carnitine CoA-transferase CaiB-like acyl-CoA transferase